MTIYDEKPGGLEHADSDPGSVLGSENHFLKFHEWLTDGQLVSFGQLTESLIHNRKDPNLLGGILRFLSMPATHQILEAWADQSRIARLLKRASSRLFHDFPQVRSPSLAVKIADLLYGNLETDYFSSHFSTRNPTGVEYAKQSVIHTLRVWILVKGYEFAAEGASFDGSLKVVSTQIRMACDDAGDSRKLDWFARFPDLIYSLTEYSAALQDHLQNPQTDQKPEQFGIPSAIVSAFKCIVRGEKHPIARDKSALARPILGEFVWPKNTDEMTGAPIAEDEQTLVIVDQNEVHEFTKISLENQPALSLPQVFKESRSIAFLSQEDHQFLRNSWSRINQSEQAELLNFFRQKLADGSAEEQLIVSLALIAIICRRSMDTVRSIKICAEVAPDWQLNPSAMELVRNSPRREVRWHQQGEHVKARALSKEWRAQFCPSVQAVLTAAISIEDSPDVIGQLWTSSSASLEQAFNAMCQAEPNLKRIRSGMLPRLFEQELFESSLDATFAHLVTATGSRGISGAGAYPSWTSSAVKKMLPHLFADLVMIEPGEEDQNCMGSELDPDDQMLAALVQATCARVNASKAGDSAFIAHHNAVTAYTAMLLLCATGARPVDAMFEASAHFDFDRGLVYIEDKVSPYASSERSGRIVPLPWSVVEYLKTEYLPYLASVATKLQQFVPAIADEIYKQAHQQHGARMPMLFLMRLNPDFDWCPVSTSALEQVGLLEGLTPWNLFRHRLASRLRTNGLDPELIDAQLGHASAATESFGEYSPRIFEFDCTNWRDRLEESLSSLHIQIPKISQTIECPAFTSDVSYLDQRMKLPFGHKARRDRRKHEHALARKVARAEIMAFLDGRSLDQLRPSEWEALGRQMLMNSGNLPQPYALIRYDTLEHVIANEWSSKSSRPNIKRWLSRPPPARAGFSPRAVNAARRLSEVRQRWDAESKAKPLSKMSLTDCALHAALDVCLHGLVSNPKILMSIAQADQTSISLLVFESQAYFEYREPGSHEGRACLRLACPRHAFLMLEKALASKYSIDPSKANTPSWLLDLLASDESAKAHPTDVKSVLEHLSDLTYAESSLSMPSVLAAILHGEVAHYSLPRSDWVRAQLGKSFDLTESVDHIGSEESEPLPTWPESKVVIKRPTKADHDANYQAAVLLLKEVQKALRNYQSPEKVLDDEALPSHSVRASRTTNQDTQKRRNTITQIRRALTRNEMNISRAMYSYVEWIIHLLDRPLGSRRLDVASVDRYFNSLRRGFLAFGHSIDIWDADADELTDFYSDVVHPEHSDEAGSDDSPTGQYKDKLYLLQRLQDFHRFAKGKYGVDEPDWSLISDGVFGSTANPGVITPLEYELALSALCGDPSRASKDALIDAYILLLCYRFGLRAGEAANLARWQWVDVRGSIVVLVSGHHKKLKTRNSQRQVPLIGKLNDKEQEIVRCWLDRWALETGNDEDIPLFFDRPVKWQLINVRPHRERIIRALRKSTQSKHINLHHARHSFGNRVALPVLAPACDAVWRVFDAVSADHAAGVKRLLLTTEATTRRSIWAIARLLGHVTPQTTIGSYLHFLGDWSNAIVRKRFPNHHEQLKTDSDVACLNMDKLTESVGYLAPFLINQSEEKSRLSCELIVKYLRLQANGFNSANAVYAMNISNDEGERLKHTLANLNVKLRARQVAADRDQTSSLLATHIQRNRWEYLIGLAKSMDRQVFVLDAIQREEGLRLISPSRQILLWEESHFFLVKQFLMHMKWSISGIAIYHQQPLEVEVSELAAKYGFMLLSATSSNGKKQIQLDYPTWKNSVGFISRVTNNLAMVRSSANEIVGDSFELVLIWVCYCLSTAQIQQSSNASGVVIG